MGVMRFGQGVIGHVGVEVLSAASAMMLRVDQVNVTRAASNQVSHVMQDTGVDAVPSATPVASGTGLIWVVTASANDPCFGQILWVGSPLGAVRQVFSGTGHGKALLGQVFPARNLRHLPKYVTVNLPVMMLNSRYFQSLASLPGVLPRSPPV